MTQLCISVLGTLRVTLDGAPVSDFESAKARALLVYLAVEADRSHNRDALAGLLWPDEPDQTARNNLRQTLAGLRRTLGDRQAPSRPLLCIERDSIQLNPSANCWTDVAEIRRHLTRCSEHTHRHPETCHVCAAEREQAVALYQGDFLQHFFLSDSSPFDEWALLHRERLRRQVLEALESLVDFNQWRGDFDKALQFALRQLELDPWREQAYRQTMRAYVARGDRSAALAQFEACRRILLAEMNAAPSLETLELYESIRLNGHGGIPPADKRSAHVPLPSTPFLGRRHELAELARLLMDPACRLITLVGLGGVGKTRLALAAAQEQSLGFRDGVAFVPLASTSSPDLIPSAILAALDVPSQAPGDPKESLLGYLREREVLLVLDNWEHLQEASGLLSELLQQAPRIALLVTSRERLNLQGEWVLDLAGLDVPEGAQTEEVEEYSAVQLFLQVARRESSNRSFSDEEKSSIVRICRLVEGVPLAIELAAAWVRTLSCREIAEEIEESYSILVARSRDLPERHRSLRAVFEHSWKLLDEEEQQVFSRLSVFRGGFRRDASEYVAGASLSILAALVDKSLVRSDGAERYDLHELVRQFAEKELAGMGQREPTRDQHLAYWVGVAEQAEPRLTGPRQKEWFDLLHDEHDNLHAALAWALESRQVEAGLRMAGALWRFWYIRGDVVQARKWFEQLLEPDDAVSPAVRAKALAGAGWLAYAQCEFTTATVLGEQSLSLQRELKDNRSIAVLLNSLGLIASDQRDAVRAKSYLEESLGLFRALGDDDGLARCLNNLANLAFEQGDTPAAIALHEESLALSLKCGDKHMVANSLLNLGWSFSVAGDSVRAVPYFAESLVICRELGHHIGTTFCLEGLAGVAGMEQNPRRAARLFGAAASLRESVQAPLAPVNKPYMDSMIALVQKQLDPAAFAAAWEAGRAMTMEQTIEYAVSNPDGAPAAPK